MAAVISKRKPKKEDSGYRSAAQKWEAILRRDSKADGIFYYAVQTTGVYCRPSCSSRMPRPENVSFYTSCQEAERAGFRACKRCQPDGPGLTVQHAAMVSKACRIIESGERMLKLDDLAKTVGASPFHFHRIFTQMMGLTPKSYAMARRAEKIRKGLPESGSVTQAIYDAGYPSSGRFYAESSRMLGMKPRAFRKGGAGTTIRFAVGECSLGSILVASSETGVCAIFLGNDPGELLKNLQDRFSKTHLIEADHNYKQTVAHIVGLVENPGRGLHLPLDIRGTAFQKRVWQALEKIPLGKTASYAEIARRIGMPRAARAVARACAANSLAIVIPCHRVVRTDGDLSGYRWGVERKKILLAREAGSGKSPAGTILR